MNPHVRLLVGWMIGWSICHNNVLKRQGIYTFVLLSEYLFVVCLGGCVITVLQEAIWSSIPEKAYVNLSSFIQPSRNMSFTLKQAINFIFITT